MTPVLALHVGIHKTGSTSIQIALKQNQDAGNLAQAGVNYVSATRGTANAHHAFAQLTRRAPASDSHSHALAAISEEVLENPEMLHVMSSEAFDLCPPDAHRVLCEHFLASGIDLRIVVTLRDAESLLGSVFQQHLKQGLIPSDENAFISLIISNRGDMPGKGFAPYIHMDVFIATLSRIYGNNALKIYSYKDIFSAPDGLAYFLKGVGAHSKATEFNSLPFVNETLSLEKLSFLSWLAAELRQLTKGASVPAALRPTLYALSKAEIAGTKYLFPINEDAVKLCEAINVGLSKLVCKETIPLQVPTKVRTGTPILRFEHIPEEQRAAFLHLAARNLDSRWHNLIVGTNLIEANQSLGRKFFQGNVTKISHVVGPSHGIRWNWHIRDGVVSCDLPADRVIGVGGAPIWSRHLFATAKEIVIKGGVVGVMVGHFRFGNGIAQNAEAEAAPLFQGGVSGIVRAAISPDVDRRMQERGMAAVRVWHDELGTAARFIFWDLFGRQVFDRLAGHHITDGRYRHPVFNYADTVAQFPNADIVDLSPLLRQPMHEVRRLFIDASCHPSQIGYLFLNDVLCRGRDAMDAYNAAVSAVESEIFAYACRLRAAYGGAVLLTGRSVWLETLSSYMGASGAIRLARAGLVLAPLTRVLGQPSIDQVLQVVPLERCNCIVLSAEGRDLSAALAPAFGTAPAFWRGAPCIDWETATVPAITQRGEKPRHALAGGRQGSYSEIITPNLAGHMVEQGPLGMPSWTGITHLLESVVLSTIPERHRGRQPRQSCLSLT